MTGDRNSQQQIIQPNRNPSIPEQQQIVQLQQSGSFVSVNESSNNFHANDGIVRTPSNFENTSQNSINNYSSPASGATSFLSQQNNSTNASSAKIQATPTSHLDSSSPIAKKRLKLEVADSSSSCGSTTIEDLTALKSRILEHKFQRLKGLVEK